MKAIESGIVRKMDDKGTVHIPKSVREKLGITSNQEFEVLYTNDSIIFRIIEKL